MNWHTHTKRHTWRLTVGKLTSQKLVFFPFPCVFVFAAVCSRCLWGYNGWGTKVGCGNVAHKAFCWGRLRKEERLGHCIHFGTAAREKKSTACLPAPQSIHIKNINESRWRSLRCLRVGCQPQRRRFSFINATEGLSDMGTSKTKSLNQHSDVTPPTFSTTRGHNHLNRWLVGQLSLTVKASRRAAG